MLPQRPELPTTYRAIAALLLAVDVRGLGGALLDHPLHEQARDFARLVQQLLPDGAPLRRMPTGVTADRLYGGIDLGATLAAGRLIAERGVLAAAHGGVVVVPMAERLPVAARTALSEILDHAEVQVARDGIGVRHDACVGTLLIDESIDDEFVHPALRDRLAFALQFSSATGDELEAARDPVVLADWRRRVHEARQRVFRVEVEDRWVQALCETADSFGVESIRASSFALRCARAHAALHGRTAVGEADAEIAAALILAPRATRVPVPPDESVSEERPPESPAEQATDTPPEPPPSSEQPQEQSQEQSQKSAPDVPEGDSGDTPAEEEDDAMAPSPEQMGELLRNAVSTALPPGLLATLLARQNKGTMQGRVGAETPNMMRGRPRGARPGAPRGGARLHLLETLRAAAPWQRLRNASATGALPAATSARVQIRREDFRIRRFIERTGTTVIFLVDASGSSALNRLAEAKGAVEMLLAESYARRDRVSLLAFRGQGSELLLPPTRALARAKKVLAALPGGGGTPMAQAIDAAIEQALSCKRAGSAPLVVILTDGRANIARDGTPGRVGAERDALLSGAQFARLAIPALFVDTSKRGEPMARRIADAMHARYVPLPSADAKTLGGLVRTAIQMADAPGRA